MYRASDRQTSLLEAALLLADQKRVHGLGKLRIRGAPAGLEAGTGGHRP